MTLSSDSAGGRAARYAIVEMTERQRSGRLAAEVARLRQAEAVLGGQNAILERRLARCQALLGATEREFAELSYCFSHDLRAPLRAMSGFSRIVLDEHAAALDPEAQRLLHAVDDNALGMSHLIDGILEFLRWARKTPKPAAVDVRRLVAQTFGQLRPRAGRDIRLDVGDLPEAWADRAMLQAVISNLLSNAIKFTSLREKALIEIGGTNGPGENSYYVRDNGVGFDMAYSNRLFRFCERAHSRGQFQGAGAGLAVVRQIIERHGGHVRAEGKAGEGAAIHFTLPVQGTMQ